MVMWPLKKVPECANDEQVLALQEGQMSPFLLHCLVMWPGKWQGQSRYSKLLVAGLTTWQTTLQPLCQTPHQSCINASWSSRHGPQPQAVPSILTLPFRRVSEFKMGSFCSNHTQGILVSADSRNILGTPFEVKANSYHTTYKQKCLDIAETSMGVEESYTQSF